jgi:hypothetical protein
MRLRHFIINFGVCQEFFEKRHEPAVYILKIVKKLLHFFDIFGIIKRKDFTAVQRVITSLKRKDFVKI